MTRTNAGLVAEADSTGVPKNAKSAKRPNVRDVRLMKMVRGRLILTVNFSFLFRYTK